MPATCPLLAAGEGLRCVPNSYYYPDGCGKAGQPCCEDSGPGLKLLWNCQPGSYCFDYSGYSGEHGGGVGVWHNNHTCLRWELLLGVC